MKDSLQNALMTDSKTINDFLELLPFAIIKMERSGIIKYSNNNFRTLFDYQNIRNTTNINSVFTISPQTNDSEKIDILKTEDNKPLKIITHNNSIKTIFLVKKELFDEANFSSEFLIYISDLSSNVIDIEDDIYQSMIEDIEDYAILSLDLDGKILKWNKGAKKIKGYDSDEIIGKNFSCFYTKEDQEQMLPQKILESAKKNGKSSFEGWRVRKDGTQFWGQITITAIKNRNKKVVGFSKITKDLTSKKIADDKLLEYAKSMENQNRQLEEFAYVASHDLQDPLRKIQLFASILEKNTDNQETLIKTIQKISQSADRMSKLIKDILRYSVISNTDYEMSEVNLNLTLEDVLENLEVLINEKSAQLFIEDMPKLTGIPIQLHQLFYNLISNAIKYNNKIPIIKINPVYLTKEQTLQYENLDQNLSYVNIFIEDNGNGFDQQYADKIFKVFQRLGEKTSGSGIGLALCKKIVENHHGMIQVNSILDKGTTFNIILPLKQA